MLFKFTSQSSLSPRNHWYRRLGHMIFITRMPLLGCESCLHNLIFYFLINHLKSMNNRKIVKSEDGMEKAFDQAEGL